MTPAAAVTPTHQRRRTVCARFDIVPRTSSPSYNRLLVSVDSKGGLVQYRAPAFAADSRANRVAKHVVATRKNDPQCTRLYLCGPSEAEIQIRLAAPGVFRHIEMPPTRGLEYSHVLEFPTGVPADVLSLTEQLKKLLTMRSRKHIDFAIALDWYKLPPEPGSDEFVNTETGELVYRGKYYKLPTPRRNAARTGLVKAMADTINSHPVLARASTIVTVPGHNGDGTSFGEKLAGAVAKEAEKDILLTECINGPRAEAKGGDSGKCLDGQFTLPTAVSGEVIILDDVYRTGATMSAVALAARQAGAAHVYGLAAVRTLRN